MRTGVGPTLRAVLGRVALLGLLVLLAVGLRARSPLEADDRAWRLDDLLDRGSGTLKVLVVVWIAIALAVMAWSLSRREGFEAPPPKRRSIWFSLLLLCGFVVVAALVPRLRRATDTGVAEPLPGATPPPVAGSGGHRDLVSETEQGLVVLVALTLLVLLAVTVRARRRILLEGPPVEEPGLEEGLAAAARVLRERVLEEPRERVLAAYEAFEHALAARGLRRGASGTPSLLLERAVAQGAPPEPARELTRLFGAARFGRTPVTEQDVRAAEHALDALRVHQ